MSDVLDGLLAQLATLAGRLSPLAKAIVAAVLPLATALVNMALAGSFNTTSIVVLATGTVSALAVYLIPNKTKPAAPAKPAPVPAPILVPPGPPAK